MKTDYERPLIAYAYLAQSGAQNDILSGLVPLLTPIAKSKAGKSFDRDILSAELKRLYGIEVHPWAVDELAPRMEDAGILIKKSITKAGAIYSYTDSLGEELSTTSEEDIQNTLDDFINYSKEIMLQAKINVPEDLLRKHLFNQIATSDFQIRLIKPNTAPKDGRRILQLKENKELSEDEACDGEVCDGEEFKNAETSQQKQIDQMKIISASYVLHTSVNNKKIYEQLLHIASGAILAEYILNLRAPNNNFTLSSLKIYLDGPLAMSYLDLNEEKASNYTLMLIESLRDKGASLLIFKGHVDEIRDNLRSAMNQDGSGIRRPTHRRMQGASFRSYAQSILSDLEGTFRRKQITIVSPSKSPSYFSDDAMESLTQALGDYAYHARERDAQAVGSVIRLRAGKINSRSFFHECQHIFLSENKRVASASFNFAIEKIGYKENYVPPVVTDRYLAGLMFVLYGGETASKLNHQKLLANCASALEPNHALLSKVTTFLSDVTDSRAGAFVELMTSSRASQHRAIFLLDETRVIHDLADAEQAFEDFEIEMKRSMDAEFIVERQKIAEAHKAEIDAAAASRATLELEQTLAEAQYKENIAQQNIAIKNLEQELISKTQSLDSLFERQAKQEAAFAASQLEDIKDLLAEASKKVNQEKKIISWSLGIISFILIALVNLWGLNIGNSLTLKIVCAILLVSVPLALPKISNAVTNRQTSRRRRDKFYQLLKSRSNLRNIASNYKLDFSTGNAEILEEDSEGIIIDTGKHT